MSSEIFKTPGLTSNDEIELLFTKNPHKVILAIKFIDDIGDHLKLITHVCESMKKYDIKWVEITINFVPKIPLNAIHYINKYNGNFICHIEDFEKFYLTNLYNLIKLSHVFIFQNKKKQIDDSADGWIKITDWKKEKKNKFNKIKEDLLNLVGDWNNM